MKLAHIRSAAHRERRPDPGDIARLIAAALLAAAVIAAMAARAGAQHIPSATPAAAPVTMEILPTLKGHMARLETLMNFLFRHIGDADKANELTRTVREMSWHLRRAACFRPESVALLPDAGQESAAMGRFRACLDKAQELLGDLEVVIAGRGGGTPKALLLELDRTRRVCHAAFG